MGLMATTTAVCRVLSEKYGATVRIFGGKAFTDGKTYTIPDLGELDDNKLTILRGYLDHEAGGHGKHTDFDALKAIKDKKHHSLTNMLEDIRVETLQGATYPGCKVNLTALNEMISAEFVSELTPMRSLFIEGYKRVAGQKLSHPDCSEKAISAFGEDIFDRIAELKNTEQTVALAAALIGEIEESLKPEPEPEAEEKGGEGEGEELREGEGEKVDTEESETEGPEGSGSGDEPGSEEPRLESEEPEIKESADPPKSPGETPSGLDIGEEKGRVEDLVSDPEEDMEEALEELDDLKGKEDSLKEKMGEMHREAVVGGYVVFSTEDDEIYVAEEAGSKGEYESLKETLGPINVLRTKMARMFMSQKASRWIGDRDRGRINNRALAKIATGNRRIFKDKYQTQEINTAVSFLVDFSGSMRKGKMASAMASVVMFLETLEPIGVKSEVLGYTTGMYCRGYDREEGYGRVEALKTVIFKSFSETNNNSVKLRISAWRRVRRAENCDPCSLAIALDRLVKRPERRKIIFVLTDGCVSSMGDNTAGRTELNRMVKEVEKSGVVEIIGVGLMTSWAKGTYTNCIDVSDPALLVPALFDGLKAHLLK